MKTIQSVLLFKPSLILCGSINFSILCLFINKLFKTPYVSITHGIEAWKMKRLGLVGLKNSISILSVSNYTRNKILSQLPDYPRDRILILPNTFNSDKFRPADKSQSLMKKLNITREDKVILTIARLSKTEGYKGYDKVIVAIKDILKDIPNLKYIIGGHGDDITRIKQLIKDNVLEDKVILAGFIPEEELCDYYNLCDVFVMPSKGEGFGIVFLEALACGKPVIAGNRDGSVDAVLNGEVGILVNPDNSQELVEMIKSVLNCKANKMHLGGKHLRERVIKSYGFTRFQEKLNKFLNFFFTKEFS
jgi:glycosyltransferase involved in cell wall biosynthesis